MDRRVLLRYIFILPHNLFRSYSAPPFHPSFSLRDLIFLVCHHLLSLSLSLSFLLLRTCRFYLFFTIIREVSNSERSRHSLLSSVRDICSFFDSPYFSCRARNVFFFSFLFPFFFFFTDVESLPTALMNLNCLSAVGEITSL